ncbi:MAG: response regulator [Candidatus Fibromonas sp.]|nr:response regulator [Candidatus Fibromonas sp.]
MMLRKFRIKTRLLISFFVVVLFTLIVGLTGYTRLTSLGTSAVRTIRNVSIMNDIYDYNVSIDAGIFNILYISEINLTHYLLQVEREQTEKFLEYLNKYLDLQGQFGDVFTPGEMQNMANLLEMYKETYIPVVNNIFTLIEQGRRDEALSVYINRFTPIFNSFTYYINFVFMKNLDNSLLETERNNKSASINAYLMLAVVLLSLIVSVILALTVTKSVAAPLLELETAAGKVANGELDVQFEVSHGNDEIAHLSVRLDKTLQQLNQAQQLKLAAIEAQLEREKAETANRTKSSFLATMSHEIRTPMSAIIGMAQIQLQKENLPDEYASVFQKINNSGNNLLGIINDILDMSKIETGKMELNPAEYDVPSLINDAVQLNIVRIGSKPIEFMLDASETLPSKLFGDELRLKQILNNLLSNAIKYTGKGQVKLSVSHSLEGESVMLRFVVRDSGQGMKSEDRERLFSEYLRFNAEANRATEGTGLGLNITKKLVEMMDGTIAVESEYGWGSTFTVTVRQKAVECRAIGPELAKRLRNFTFTGDKQAAQLRITHEPMPYGSVLVVDDVETNLYVAEGLLSPYKLKIETADSGFAAIEKIQGGKTYDVIFMDHMMPKMDGIETTEKLRELGYKGVIVALTANALVGNAEMFAQHGFDEFIPKPIDISHLNAVLNKFVRDRHSEDVKKYEQQTAVQVKTAAIDPKLRGIFCRDAEKAIITLRKTAASGDLKLFTITAHAMKSALANVDESEISASAYKLEMAGFNGDRDFIAAHTENFIETLETLVKNFAATET